MGLGCARHPHVLCVRSGGCAQAVPKLLSLATPSKRERRLRVN
ncbi:DNA metabolism protein [Yersinia kristensenii]|nr:DNA metabolism protein [Yersinia kristensenii]